MSTPEAVTQRLSAVWGSGPYQRVTETLADVHEAVIEAARPARGDRFLDLACGTGAVAERAAARGAQVTGVDLAPALLEVARERAARLELDIDYRTGNCERLELPDGSYDAVASTFGIMFAVDHAASAAELARVTAPGGRMVLASWTPDPDGVKALFSVMAPFQPGPPPANPFAWGEQAHVEELLGEAFELAFETRVSALRAPSAEAYWELFATDYGPTRTLAESLGPRREELHSAWLERFPGGPDGGVVHEREYLLVTGARRR